MPEQFHIALKSYYRSISETFQEAKFAKCLQDTTFGNKDQSLSSNIFVLSAASPMMKNVFKTSEFSKAKLVHKNASIEEIEQILHYIHTGETTDERKMRFLRLGAEMKIEGLMSMCSNNNCYKIEESFNVTAEALDNQEEFCSKECFDESIFNSFQTLRHEDFLKDVTIVTTDKKEIPTNKIVLYTFSGFFKKFVKSKKKVAKRLWVPYTKEEFETLLTLLYTGRVTVDGNNVSKVLNMMNTFEITDHRTEKDSTETEKISNDACQISKNEVPMCQNVLNQKKIFEESRM